MVAWPLYALELVPPPYQEDTRWKLFNHWWLQTHIKYGFCFTWSYSVSGPWLRSLKWNSFHPKCHLLILIFLQGILSVLLILSIAELSISVTTASFRSQCWTKSNEVCTKLLWEWFPLEHSKVMSGLSVCRAMFSDAELKLSTLGKA